MGSVLLALLGTTIYSAGVIIQKKSSGWMNRKDKINGRFISAFSVWLLGILLSYAISAIPVGIASKSLPPHIVSSVNAWSIVAIVFMSGYFLKEKLMASDIVYSVVIVGSILVMSLSGNENGAPSVNDNILNMLFFLPFLLLVPVFFKFTDRKQKTILLSVFSGILAGLIVVFMNVLVKESGGSMKSILSSPYLYVYFAAGIVSVGAKQAAYRLGDVILITPLQTSFSMIYPLLCSYILFNSDIKPLQILLVILIVLACWGIQKKR